MLVKSAGVGLQADRLQRQIAKQRQARDDNPLDYVRIPASSTRGRSTATTRRRWSTSTSRTRSSTSTALSTVSVDRAGDMILGYVDMELARSTLTPVPSTSLTDKLDGVEATLRERGTADRYAAALDAARGRIRESSTVEIPLGPCHGDLTTSNVLFAHDSSAIALVDFLDSFLESPLVDLAKLARTPASGGRC